MKHWIDLLWNHLPDFVSALFFLFVAWLVIGRLLKVIEFTMIHRTLSPTLRSFVKSFVGVALKTIVLITAAGIAGFEVTSLVTLIGAAGLAIGLSLQGELQNFAGGVMLLFFKPFEVEDYITVGQYTGKVEEIQIFNTKLRTAESHQVILPNKMLSNEVITNYTKSDEVVLPIAFSESVLSFDWDNSFAKCSEIVRHLHQQNLILQNHFELRITKSEGQSIYLNLLLKATRASAEEVKHQFWLAFHNVNTRK
jgi:small conductance mechanosensitive channel